MILMLWKRRHRPGGLVTVEIEYKDVTIEAEALVGESQCSVSCWHSLPVFPCPFCFDLYLLPQVSTDDYLNVRDGLLYA